MPSEVQGHVMNPSGVVNFVGSLWLPIVAAGLVMGLLYVAITMISGVSTLKYAIVGFFGRRGQGKSFSMVYYVRKWGQSYRDKDVWTNMSRLDIEGRAVCLGKPREWGSAITADGRKSKSDAGWTLRHHVHNPRDCWWCHGVSHDGHGPSCLVCDLEECDRTYTAPVRPGQRHNWLSRLLRRKFDEQGPHCLLAERVGAALVHVESEYMDFAHAYDGLCAIDEAGQIFASTMWSKLPFAALKFLADTRKRHLLVIYTAHTPARVSKNLRELTDEAFECTNWKGFGFFRLKHFEGCLVEQTQVAYVPFLKSVQASYDTDEIVAPPGGLVSMAEAVGRKEVKLKALDAAAA
jgi:hypothetical protein